MASADEALESTLAEIPGTDDRIVSLLWEFARKVENNDERDAVLAALGNLFVKRNDLLHAAGLASLQSGRTPYGLGSWRPATATKAKCPRPGETSGGTAQNAWKQTARAVLS
jgi:hypothetical protein